MGRVWLDMAAWAQTNIGCPKSEDSDTTIHVYESRTHWGESAGTPGQVKNKASLLTFLTRARSLLDYTLVARSMGRVWPPEAASRPVCSTRSRSPAPSRCIWALLGEDEWVLEDRAASTEPPRACRPAIERHHLEPLCGR